MGNSALFKGDYKAVNLGAWLQGFGVAGAGSWQLYNLKDDPSELQDLSEVEPEVLAEMIEHYVEYSESLGIIDVPADFDPLSMITGGK